MSLMTNQKVLMVRNVGRKIGLNKLLAKIFRSKDYEYNFSNLMLNSILEGDCVWDIGANIGFYSKEFANRVGKKGKVICFEPSSLNIEKLKSETKSFQNIEIQMIALGETKSTVNFIQGTDDIGATSRIVDQSTSNNSNTVTVEVERGDNLIENHSVSSPTVLKIDTEGFEYDVIKGLTNTLNNESLREIFIEMHFGLLEQRGLKEAPKKIEEMLKESGFKCKWADSSHIAAHRPEV